jgi:hypothetical protein
LTAELGVVVFFSFFFTRPNSILEDCKYSGPTAPKLHKFFNEIEDASFETTEATVSRVRCFNKHDDLTCPAFSTVFPGSVQASFTGAPPYQMQTKNSIGPGPSAMPLSLALWSGCCRWATRHVVPHCMVVQSVTATFYPLHYHSRPSFANWDFYLIRQNFLIK